MQVESDKAMSTPDAVRGDLNQVLNGLVREGVLTGFRTNFAVRKEAGWQPEVFISVPDLEEAGQALRCVRHALESLGTDLTVVLDLREQGQGEGCRAAAAGPTP